jgi:hypothetical protein
MNFFFWRQQKIGLGFCKMKKSQRSSSATKRAADRREDVDCRLDTEVYMELGIDHDAFKTDYNIPVYRTTHDGEMWVVARDLARFMMTTLRSCPVILEEAMCVEFIDGSSPNGENAEADVVNVKNLDKIFAEHYGSVSGAKYAAMFRSALMHKEDEDQQKRPSRRVRFSDEQLPPSPARKEDEIPIFQSLERRMAWHLKSVEDTLKDGMARLEAMAQSMEDAHLAFLQQAADRIGLDAVNRRMNSPEMDALVNKVVDETVRKRLAELPAPVPAPVLAPAPAPAPTPATVPRAVQAKVSESLAKMQSELAKTDSLLGMRSELADKRRAGSFPVPAPAPASVPAAQKKAGSPVPEVDIAAMFDAMMGTPAAAPASVTAPK